MNRKDIENDKKKAITLNISEKLYTEFYKKLFEIYGKTFGCVGSEIENAIFLWLNEQNKQKVTQIDS